MLMGHQIGQALCDALGLPPKTLGFTLRCYSGEVVTVECEYCPADGTGFIAALAEYSLVRRPRMESTEPLDFDGWIRDRKETAHRAFMAIRHAA